MIEFLVGSTRLNVVRKCGSLLLALAVTAATVLFLDTPAAQAWAAGDTAPSTTITGNLTSLSYPWGVAVDKNDYIYAPNRNANSVTVYAPGSHDNALPVRTIVGTNTGLSAPRTAAVDSGGRIYVTSTTGNSVTVFSSVADGDVPPVRKLVGAATQLSQPEGVAFDAADNMYITDFSNNSITVYASGVNGNTAPLRRIQGGLTQLGSPNAIAFDSEGDLYVSNFNSGTVTVYDGDAVNNIATGTTANLAPIRVLGGGLTGISQPGGVALDSTNNLYVSTVSSTPANNSVRMFTPAANGNQAPAKVLAGSATGMWWAAGVVINNDSDLYVANSQANSITVYTNRVAYSPNGATGGTTPAPTDYATSAQVTVSANTGALVRTGYQFDNWNTAADGSGTPYVAGDTFTMPSGNVVLYAQWIANQAQTITFTSPTPSGATPGGGTYTPTATGGGSGNPVTFSIDGSSTSGCQITGGVVSYVAPNGTCVINANQAGDATYAPAQQVQQTFTIATNAQTISFGTAPTLAVGGTGTVSATGSQGGTVSYASNTPSTCTVDPVSGVVTGVAAGTNNCSIQATAAAVGSYSSATDAQTFSIDKGTQTVTFTSTAPAAIVGETYAPTAQGGASGEPVVFSIDPSTTANCSISVGVVTFNAVGQCLVNANQAGNANYEAASGDQQAITIATNVQTISFGTAPTIAVGGTGTVSATGSQGGTVTYSSNTPSTCTVDPTSGIVTGIAAGTNNCSIQATAAAISPYTIGTDSQTFSIDKGTQTVTFTSTAPAAIVGETYSPTAQGGASGEPVVFSIDPTTTANCSISAGVVTFNAVGQCLVNANQAGNSDYEASNEDQQAITTDAQVSFDPNGGVGTMPAQVGGASAVLYANTFTRADYVFTGWNTDPVGGGTAYANEAGYPFDANATLFAQWELVPTPPQPRIRLPQSLPANGAPKKIKYAHRTVLNKAGARTQQGLPVTARASALIVRGDTRCFVIKKGPRRKLVIRTFGVCNLRLVVRYTAPGNAYYLPFKQKFIYRVR